MIATKLSVESFLLHNGPTLPIFNLITKLLLGKTCMKRETLMHDDPLMMSQKEAPRKHPLVLPRKVACLVCSPCH